MDKENQSIEVRNPDRQKADKQKERLNAYCQIFKQMKKEKEKANDK